MACCMVYGAPVPRDAVNLAFRIVSNSILSKRASRDLGDQKGTNRPDEQKTGRCAPGEGGSGLADGLAVAGVAL